MTIYGDIDGLRIAIEIEKRGCTLYRRVLLIVKEARIHALLATLLDDEIKHTHYFESLLRDLEKDGDVGADMESTALFAAVASDIAFPGGILKLVGCAENTASIIASGIDSENQSIAFYEHMLRNTASAAVRSVFSEIITEEKRHLARLEELL